MPKQLHCYSDFELVALLKAGDIDAFDTLYRRYFAKLYNHAYEKLNNRTLAQEVVQDLFVSFWQNRDKLDVRVSLASYFFVSLRNLIINQFKKRLIYQRHLDQAVSKHPQVSNEINEWLDYKDLQMEYQQALQALPEKCREVFLLSRNGASHKEIAAIHNISIKTVEQHISKALRTLRVLLNAQLNTFMGMIGLASIGFF